MNQTCRNAPSYRNVCITKNLHPDLIHYCSCENKKTQTKFGSAGRELDATPEVESEFGQTELHPLQFQHEVVADVPVAVGHRRILVRVRAEDTVPRLADIRAQDLVHKPVAVIAVFTPVTRGLARKFNEQRIHFVRKFPADHAVLVPRAPNRLSHQLVIAVRVSTFGHRPSQVLRRHCHCPHLT